MKQILSLFLLFLTLMLSATGLLAQVPGSLDASFNPGTGANGVVYSVAVQVDGQILIGGNFTTYKGASRKYIARLNADGSLDATFNPSGTSANSWVQTITVQPNGKIIIGGNFTTYNGSNRKYIARLNADGSLDTSFNPSGTSADAIVHKTVVQPDGKIIIGGYFNNYNGTGRNYIARLNADGSLDTSFNPGMGPNDYVYAIVLQPNGKIIIGGDFSAYNGTIRNYIARLNADGTLDASFNPGIGPGARVNAIAMQPDGKILIGGVFTSYNGINRNYIARVNSDGSLDASFTPNLGPNNLVTSIALQTSGKIIIGGAFTTYGGANSKYIARLNADASRDASFVLGSGANAQVNSMALQADGKIVIGGDFLSYNGTSRIRVARINGGTSTGITEALTGVEVKLYPNPSQGKFQVELSGLKTAIAELSITDLAGKTIQQKEIKVSNGSISETVELKTAKGIYLLQLKSEEQSIIRKVVIE